MISTNIFLHIMRHTSLYNTIQCNNSVLWLAVSGAAQAWRSAHRARGTRRPRPEPDPDRQEGGRHGRQEGAHGSHLRAFDEQGQAVAKVLKVTVFRGYIALIICPNNSTNNSAELLTCRHLVPIHCFSKSEGGD